MVLLPHWYYYSVEGSGAAAAFDGDDTGSGAPTAAGAAALDRVDTGSGAPTAAGAAAGVAGFAAGGAMGGATGVMGGAGAAKGAGAVGRSGSVTLPLESTKEVGTRKKVQV